MGKDGGINKSADRKKSLTELDVRDVLWGLARSLFKDIFENVLRRCSPETICAVQQELRAHKLPVPIQISEHGMIDLTPAYEIVSKVAFMEGVENIIIAFSTLVRAAVPIIKRDVNTYELGELGAPFFDAMMNEPKYKLISPHLNVAREVFSWVLEKEKYTLLTKEELAQMTKERSAALGLAEAKASALAETLGEKIGELSHIRARSKALENAYLKLRDIDEWRARFVDAIAHELKNPLTLIKGYADMLKDEDITEANVRQSDILDLIARNADKMTTTIDSMLNLSRIEGLRMAISKSAVSLHRVISRVLSSESYLLDEKRHKLTVALAKDLHKVRGDEFLLQTVVRNLVNNAAKYTPHDGEITIEADNDNEDDTVHLTVTDTGVGIKEEDLPKVFAKFSRISNDKRGKAKGLGIGMYITKYIVEKHGGKIRVESEYGKGTTFHVILPATD